MTPDAAPAKTTRVADREPRCWRCHKKLAEYVTRPWAITCVRCKARNQSGAVD